METDVVRTERPEAVGTQSERTEEYKATSRSAREHTMVCSLNVHVLFSKKVRAKDTISPHCKNKAPLFVGLYFYNFGSGMRSKMLGAIFITSKASI